LIDVITTMQSTLDVARQGRLEETMLAATDVQVKKAKLPYLIEQTPRALEESLEGLRRITSIVTAMREFSHPSSAEKQLADVHEMIKTTTTVARNEWKYVAELHFEFDNTLPQVPILRDEFNQVILNLIVNAVHAIADAGSGADQTKGHITIRTGRCDEYAEIRVIDTGTGIPEAVRGRIFEPFFTTKPVGKGTGQGLAVAYSVVVDKHDGKLWFETTEGVGTTFVIHLPLASPVRAEP
jgi:signal transduction histidine kinase